MYALWRDGELVHLGCAHGGDTLREKLLAHFAAGERASHYSWEIAADPRRRAWELARGLERPGETEAEAQPW